MKNFHQNLLIFLASCLCGLCAWQWYGQTVQRRAIENLNQIVYEKAQAIQSHTNSISTMDRQIAQMDARIAELKESIKTNEQFSITQRREIARLQAGNQSLTNQVGEFKVAVDGLETKLKEAYDGVKRQNDTIKELIAQRDEFVQKFNNTVKDRNDIVAKYNELAERFQKLATNSNRGER